MPGILDTQLYLRSIVTRASILPPPRRPIGTEAEDDVQWARSWDYLCRLYTPAMVRYVRDVLARHTGRPGDHDEAADVVQDYLAQALAKGWLDRDRDDIRCFRAYLQTQLARFSVSHLRRKYALKRHAPGTDSPAALDAVVRDEEDPAAELDAGWVEAIVGRVLERLREANGTYHAVILDLLRTGGAGSADLARQLGRPHSRVKDLRYRARRRFALLFFEQCRVSVRDEHAYESLVRRLQPHLP